MGYVDSVTERCEGCDGRACSCAGDSDPVSAYQAPIIMECHCGRRYTAEEFDALPKPRKGDRQDYPADSSGPGYTLIYRNCVCLSTLTRFASEDGGPKEASDLLSICETMLSNLQTLRAAHPAGPVAMSQRSCDKMIEALSAAIAQAKDRQ